MFSCQFERDKLFAKISCDLKKIEPLLGKNSPVNNLINVDLPDPEKPIIPIFSPLNILRLMFLSE